MSLKEALENAKKAGLLHVARPRECTVQQKPHSVQQLPATTVQQLTAKPAKTLGLVRNNERNNHATTHPKPMQQTGQKKGHFVAHMLRPKSEGPATVWKVEFNGRRITVIDPERLNRDQFTASMRAKFGADRVGEIVRG